MSKNNFISISELAKKLNLINKKMENLQHTLLDFGKVNLAS